MIYAKLVAAIDSRGLSTGIAEIGARIIIVISAEAGQIGESIWAGNTRLIDKVISGTTGTF
jgi:hypothetical protein